MEVWFLSPEDKVTIYQKILDHLDQNISFSKQLAQTVNTDSCHQEMGDMCFHPQLGLYDNPNKKTKEKIKDKKESEVKYLSNTDIDLINCDKNFYFDLYCGKAKKEPNQENVKVELWIDTSSSLRAVDYAKDEAGEICYRRQFAQEMISKCGEKVVVSAFDTSIKVVGTLDTLCVNRGLNDQKRMIEWIETSQAKKLILITDIAEYTMLLDDFIRQIGGKVRGADNRSLLYAKDISKLVSEASATCK